MLTLAFSFGLLGSCSLEYEEEANPESTTPEFVFNEANFTRVEKNSTKIRMNAEKIEQYKADAFSFAREVEFLTFTEEGEEETEGRCDMLSADTRNEKYILLGAIEIDMKKDNMKIRAESLNFDKRTEQITSGIDQKVTLTRSDADVSGYGFSASGVSRRFEFLRDAAGTIETDDGEEKSEETGD